MATPTLKTTYSLDVETVRMLDGLAQRWKTSRSEALRRIVRQAVTQGPADDAQQALDALEGLQRDLGLDRQAVTRWQRAVRAERSASATHREVR